MSNLAESSPAWEDGRTSIRFRSSSSPHSSSMTAAERLSDDLLVEILSRVPSKSLCRFQCVSRHWLNLIDHPDHRKELSQTLAGLFYRTPKMDERQSAIRFADVPGGRRCPPIDTSFAFLPNHKGVELLDCCNGLLLCSWYGPSGSECNSYIVCNPVREEWVMLPEPATGSGCRVAAGSVCMVAAVRLGFDPAVSSHFFVFVLLRENTCTTHLDKVGFYSSETGRWVCKAKGWKERVEVAYTYHSTVFLHGCLHFQAHGIEEHLCVAVVDTKGDTCTNFSLPGGERYYGLLHRSQGCLHYTGFRTDGDGVVVGLLVYVLGDYQRKEWMLKFSIETPHIARGIDDWAAIHPDCDLIFLGSARWDPKLMCYDMVRRRGQVVSDLPYGYSALLPYVPLYAEVQSLHK